VKPYQREPWRKALRRALRRPKGRRASHQIKNQRKEKIVYRDAQVAEHLLRAAMELAPDGPTQEAFAKISRNTSLTQKEVCVALLGTMLDGIQHGNWPQ
jgi:hypothetical protein